MSRRVPFPVRTILYMKCGRRCAMPDCKIDLLPKVTDNVEANISENAHIIGFSKNGPRAEKDLEDSEKNSESNLVVICANCHTIIDQKPTIFTTEKLMKIKIEHGKEVLEKRVADASNVGFSELEDISRFLGSDGISIQDEYTLITPRKKSRRIIYQIKLQN